MTQCIHSVFSAVVVSSVSQVRAPTRLHHGSQQRGGLAGRGPEATNDCCGGVPGVGLGRFSANNVAARQAIRVP